MRQTAQVIVFGHILKTAGSTIKSILWQQYETGSVVFSMNPRHHAARLERLSERITGGQEPVRVIVTHAGYGVHEVLPPGVDYPYFTFLREPIDRVLSNYYFFLQERKIPPDTTLDAFVTHHIKPGSNMQTAYLSGYSLACHLEGRPHNPADYDDAMLEAAKANLDRHAAIGLTERFDESLLLLRQAFGWRWHKLLYYRQNVGKKRPARPTHCAATLERVRDQNRLDLALYAYACTRFEERLAALPEEARADLRRFQWVNKQYGTLAPHLQAFLAPARTAVRSLRASSP